MTRILHIIIYMAVLVLWGCNDSGRELMPSLSREAISMTTGCQETITVNDAKRVSASTQSDIISLSTRGNNITITAISAGDAVVRVVADGKVLQCAVTVTGSSDDNENTSNPEDSDDPDAEDGDGYSFADELLDNRSRFVSKQVTLQYGREGVMVATENGNKIMFSDLDNGDSAVFVSEKVDEAGICQNATLTVNGMAVDIKEAKVERCDADGCWIHITAVNGEHLVLVVSDL